MSEALDFVKQNTEGKDLSILPGSIKWVVDSQIVFMNPESNEVTDEDARQHAPSQLIWTHLKVCMINQSVHKLLL
jgi:hypothetical protein